MIPLRRAVGAVAVLAAAILAMPGRAGGQQGQPRRVAWQVLDVPAGRVVSSSDDGAIARPVVPGSLVELPALIAALESGTVDASTRVACPGFADVDGRRLTCLHPRIRRPLTPAEALSYSCNAFFASVGARLPRERLNAVLGALGLPRAPGGSPMSLVVTGVAASPAAPSTLLRAFTRILGETDGFAMRPSTRAIVMEGLRGAAVFGTSAAFASRGVEALATAATAGTSGAATGGLVLAAWPAAHPRRAAVALVADGTGAEAAGQAVALAGADFLPGRAATVEARPVESAPVPEEPAAGAAAPVPALSVRVGFSSAGGYRVETLALEDYVARVLAGEAAPRSSPAALEALAVTVRTFALANRNRHGRDGFDMCDLTHCQVLRTPYAAVRAAAAATSGLVLAWNGAPASVYYTASCGGMTERPSNVWPGAADPPFMPSRRDTACDAEPAWTAEIAATDLRRALTAAGFRGTTLREVSVHARSDSGRVTSVQLGGMVPGEISGQALRMAVGRTLGWQLLKSTAFDVRGAPGGYRFSGRGYGHGVGFCVIGATRRAAAGASRASLLAQYFPGLETVPLSAELLRAPVLPPADPAVPLGSGEAAPPDAPPSRRATPTPAPPSVNSSISAAARAVGAVAGAPRTGVNLVLPPGDERDRRYVTALVERTLAAAAARVGLATPARVDVVFHPSSETFTRVTGEPAWSNASTAGRRIELQPLPTLRDRGELENAVAREAARVVTSTALAGRARWVQEGAAMFAAGMIPGAEIAAARRAGPPAMCPSDAELSRPASAAAWRDASTRARQCYARALAQDLRWDEIR